MALVILNDLSNETRSCIKQIDDWYLPTDAVLTTLKDPVGRPLYVWSSNHAPTINVTSNTVTTVAALQIATEVARLSVPGAISSHYGITLK